jgi:hypothetical protein
MPTVLRVGPYAFQFYAADIGEPPHVHVRRDRLHAKFWLEADARPAFNRGFADHELNVARRLIVLHRQFLLEKWHEFFDGE